MPCGRKPRKGRGSWQKYAGELISYYRRKGYPQKQAVAIAFSTVKKAQSRKRAQARKRILEALLELV